MTIDQAAAALPRMPSRARNRAFDLDDLKPTGVAAILGRLVPKDPRWLFALLRAWPFAGFPAFGWVLVTRFDDVQEVLTHDRIFGVPYGSKVKELNGGPNFLLGMADGEEYRRYRKQVMAAFRMEDVPSLVAPAASRLAHEILARSGDRLDAVEAFLTRVATLICRDYYGLDIPDPLEFGHWTIALSTHVFVDAASVVPAHRRAAEAAAERVQAVINGSIAALRNAPGRSDTVLARLLALQASDPTLSDEIIRGFLIGMITGFVPTNTLAAGNILDCLLKHPDFMAKARAAALAGDDDLLRRCLFEALRFKHIHWGVTRIAGEDYTLAAGTKRAMRVRAGKKVLASTWAAMFDGRRVKNPGSFDPARRPAEYMELGYGLHWCIGAFIAQAHITQTFKALLTAAPMRPAAGKDGELELLGFFPRHLWVEFRDR